MNLSIKSFFIFLGIFNIFLVLATIVNIAELDRNSKTLKNIEHQQFLMIQKADELRQSSDDLTRFVRTFAVTLDNQYKENYFKILDIRNGKARKPKNYSNIYWDLLEPLRSKMHPLEGKVSLKEEMAKLSYTSFEIEKLLEAENHSNALVEIETEAFNAIDGLFKDAQNNYTILDKPNQQLAIELLHSLRYHRAKESIMLPIDEFLESLAKRTQKEIDAYNQHIASNIKNIALIFSLDLLVLVLSAFLIYRKILNPIKRLTKSIKQYRQGDTKLHKVQTCKDEIGLMAEQFFAMGQRLNKKYLLIQELLITDTMTKTYNRKYFEQKLSELLGLYRRYQTPFSTLMYDIDNFKHINDTYGHSLGDKVLVDMSALISSFIRENDYLCRVGGEEFIILLSKTNLKEASIVAEKIRNKVSEMTTIPDISITISIGLCEVQPKDTEDVIYQRVDQLLYTSKKAGKNRVSM